MTASTYLLQSNLVSNCSYPKQLSFIVASKGVLSSAPLHLFSWHSWFCEALSASCFLFLTEASYTHTF